MFCICFLDEKREQSNQQNTDSYVNNTRSKSNLLASTNNLHANSAQPNSSKRHNKKASEDIASASSSNPPPATKPSSKSTHQRKISDGKLRTTGEYDMWYCQYLGLNTKQIKKDGPPPLVLLLDMSIKDAENPNLLGGHAPIIQVMQTRRVCYYIIIKLIFLIISCLLIISFVFLLFPFCLNRI